MNINESFSILMKFEGGSKITNISGDKGGLTKYGISQTAHPGIDIASLTEEQAMDIYAKEYWVPSHCTDLKPELQYIHFDTAVNCGVGEAIKILQRAAGVKDDGIIGPLTIQAARYISLNAYAEQRINYYAGIVIKDPSQARFLKGWLNRVNAIVAMNLN
jgi:lysozyme family protein